MPRTPELSPTQREIAVKLMRGLLLEYDGLAVVLAKEFQRSGFLTPGQQAISGISQRYVQCGKGVAASLAAKSGYDFAYFFESERPIIFGDLQSWPEHEREAKQSHRGAAFAPTSYFAVKHKILRGKQIKLTTKMVLDLTSEFESRAGPRLHELVGKWIQIDTRAAPHTSTSRIRATRT